MKRTVVILLAMVCCHAMPLALPGSAADDVPASAEQLRHFEQHIRPVLISKCVKCHGESRQEGDLRLDSIEAIVEGGVSGPAVVPFEGDESLILEAIRYESFEMPPSGPLSDEEIGHFERWVAGGAAWTSDDQPLRESTGELTEQDRQWWAFRPVTKPTPPEVPDDDWSRTPIDRFVMRRMHEEGLTPAPEADRRRLVRRLYFDLVGVPPTPEETEAFLADDSQDAWGRLIDRLLDDQRYGETWARFWLDLVRYAESDGWNQDAYRDDIWRYRDYVVRSFNSDKPYRDFVREQLAGDEIDSDDPEHLAAAGFLRLGIYEYNQRDARGHWNDIMNETTDVVGDVFLGMGMACARCHDHKFDPILQKDYFSLRAFFEPVIWRDDMVYATEQQERQHARDMKQWEEATEEIRQEIDALLEPYYERKWVSTVDKFPLEIQECYRTPVDQRTSWDHQMDYLISRQFWDEGGGPLRSMSKEDKARHEELKTKLAEFDDLKPDDLPGLMTVTDFDGEISPTVIPDDPESQPIAPGFLTAMSPPGEATAVRLPEIPGSTGRRTALAEWIGRDDNPLTMRVIVNRIWQQHFGRGLVATPNDFGRKGGLPTHPDLLDWLTATFVENGGSFKKLHKQILMSATWRQSAHHPEAVAQEEADPGEDLLWRAPVRRLRAEQIRNAMLQCSGELRDRVGGPSVEAKEPRRGLYVKVRRNTPEEFLHAFDMADGLTSTAERVSTTTPTQSLLMINGDYALGRAAAAADRLLEQEADVDQTVELAFVMAWGRAPDPAERDAAHQFLHIPSGEQMPQLERDRLVDLCHVLFNSNEFLYLD